MNPEYEEIINNAFRKATQEWEDYCKQVELYTKADELMMLYGTCEIVMDGDKIIEVKE